MTAPTPTAQELRAAFHGRDPFSVGLEEELMLLDPSTHDLRPCAREVVETVSGDPRFKLELPAAQLEIVLPPHHDLGEAAGALAAARRDLARATEGKLRLAAAGVHPFAAPEGELNRGERYERTLSEYGAIARRQLVFALQVHVAVGDAERALAVYNALRSYLPELAALAANGPFHGGADTGLASMRPKIAEALPRQGVPPVLGGWEEYAEALRWGAVSGAVPDPRVWWWELRPHPALGTLELRVPDAQATVAEAAAVAAVAQALVAWLADRHRAGERLPVDSTWRIEENRWSAARDGVEGTLADLETGERRPTSVRLLELIGELEPVARRLGCAGELDDARHLVRENGAMRQRAVAAEHGVHAVPVWLADRYSSGVPPWPTPGGRDPRRGVRSA